jgi:rRNA-processing protein FCF1
MEKILLDTNMFIYLEDYGIIDQKIATLTKRLFDSDEYKIVIHPKTKEEILNIKDEEKRNIFSSKISIYKEIKSPPKADLKFHNLVGCKNSHDEIDNEILFSIYRNCAQYLITNDKELIKKANKIGLNERVLSIDKALEIFKDKKIDVIRKPVFIEYKYLHELDINDSFFDSLKNDYLGFEEWFAKKQLNEEQAYVTIEDGKIKSFLMVKIEDENEKYTDFLEPFEPAKRLKISTMKVADTGKKIGESFIKIIVEKALKENVDEVYVTVFDNQKYLIEMLESYGFEKKTKKKTPKSDGKFELENVLVKDLKKKQEFYPFFKLDNKRIFIIPIKDVYHKLLFQESEKQFQLSLDDFQGKNTASNSLKKAYLCDSNTKKIEKGSILLFYSSGVKKAITSLGIVDAVFNKFDDFDEMFNLVNKRTAYSEKELRNGFKKDKLVILFKLYYSFDKYVTFDYLLENKIVNGAIQTIMQIKQEQLLKILNECQMKKELYLI